MSVVSGVTRALKNNLPKIQKAFEVVSDNIKDPEKIAAFQNAYGVITDSIKSIQNASGSMVGGAIKNNTERKILEGLADYSSVIQDSNERIWDILKKSGYDMGEHRDIFLSREINDQLSILNKLINSAISELRKAPGIMRADVVTRILRDVYGVLLSSFPFLGPMPEKDALPGAVSRGMALLYPNALLTLLDSTAVSISDILSLMVISKELFKRFKEKEEDESVIGLIADRAIQFVDNMRKRLSIAWGDALDGVDIAVLALPEALSQMERFSLINPRTGDGRGIIQSLLGTTRNISAIGNLINQILNKMGVEHEKIIENSEDRESFMQLLTKTVAACNNDAKKKRQLLELLDVIDPILISDENFTEVMKTIKEDLQEKKSNSAEKKEKMQKGGIVQTTKLSGMDGKKNLAQRQYNWIMGEIENITNSLSSFVLKRNKGNDKTIPISTRRSILAIIRSLLNIISIAKRNGAALSMTFGNFESARTNQGTEVYDLVTRVENVFNSLSGPEMDEAKSYCQNILRILENAANINNMRIVSSANITSVEDDV